MAKYKIGITEAGDAGVDLSWRDKLDTVDGAILVTKVLSPMFQATALNNAEKLIIHATCTGYGGTIVEPYVPAPDVQLKAAASLVDAGFPGQRIVIRVDPIIPTEKGIVRAADVMIQAIELGFTRFRVSIVDCYPYVRDRFQAAGLPLPYGNCFAPSSDQVQAVDAMLREIKEYWSVAGHAAKELRIESCAEPGLKEPVPCGCISAYDLNLLGLDTSDIDSVGRQRTFCMCYSGKKELLTHKQRCPNGCLYCYWKD